MLERAVDPAGPGQGGPTAASLHFARGGGRTFVSRQHVRYPFHITRPHSLDPARPDVASLILQSASGGLFGGDRLALEIRAGSGARAHVMSQAATVVHAAEAPGIALCTRLEAGPGAFLALTTDPYILFPGTRLRVGTEVVLDPGATVIVAEGFATYDPSAEARAFGRLETRCRIRRSDGTLLVDEAGAIDGTDFAGIGSPLGRYRAMGLVLVLGPLALGLEAGLLEASLDHLGVLGGATLLPNGAGVGVRLLAPGGGPLARGLDAVFAASYAAAVGQGPLLRRR